MPIFSVRKVVTQVTIFDGATVIIGGLTREEVKTVNDKIPVLGNIPLIGRLFQSSAESYQKRNLLIFVTASIVSRGGSPVRENIQNITPQSIFKDPVILTPTGTIRRNFKEGEELMSDVLNWLNVNSSVVALLKHSHESETSPIFGEVSIRENLACMRLHLKKL